MVTIYLCRDYTLGLHVCIFSSISQWLPLFQKAGLLTFKALQCLIDLNFESDNDSEIKERKGFFYEELVIEKEPFQIR